MSIYLLESSDFFPGSLSSHIPLDVGLVTSSSNGSQWYELSSGRRTSYPLITGTSISEVARADGNVFVLGTDINSHDSEFYIYQGGTYQLLYRTTSRLADVVVNSDGTLAAFTALDTGATTSHILVLALNTKAITSLGMGFGPGFASVGGVQTILYLKDTSVEAQSLSGVSTWTSPSAVYTSIKAFTPGEVVATDGTTNFAFIDPVAKTIQTWKLLDGQPSAASPVTIYKPIIGVNTQDSLNPARLGYSSTGSLWIFMSSAFATNNVFVNVAQPAQRFSSPLAPEKDSSYRVIFVSL